MGQRLGIFHVSRVWHLLLVLFYAVFALPSQAAYIDPVNSPVLSGINSVSPAQVAGLSDGRIAYLIGNATPTPRIRVVDTSGATVYETALASTLGSRASNYSSLTMYPISGGEIVVTVEGTTNGCDNNTNNLYAFMRLNAAGAIATGLTNVSAATSPYNCYTQMAELSNGNLAFTYQTTGSSYSLRIFNKTGAAITSPTSIQASGSGQGNCSSQSAYSGRIAASSGGKFLVSFHCYLNTNLYASIYNNDGTQTTVGGVQNFVVGTHNNNPNPSIVGVSDGNFIVVYAATATSYNIVQVTPVGGVTSVGTYAATGEYPFSVQKLGDGGFVVLDTVTTVNGNIAKYFGVATVYDNFGQVVQPRTNMDLAYFDQCDTNTWDCDSGGVNGYSYAPPAAGYQKGVLFPNGLSGNLWMHSFLSAPPPSAPTSLVATPGNMQASISFTTGSDNGSPITNYQYSIDGGASWSNFSPSTTTSPVTIAGLSNGTTYSIALRAVNAGGPGISSQVVSATPFTVPGAPTIGTAIGGDGQASVAFSAPASNGGSPITGYTVTSNPDGVMAGGAGFTTSPIVVSGLTNGTSYSFTVVAHNAAGSSSSSGASNVVTPHGNQSISFANPGPQNFGTGSTLSASATSGLPVTFSSSTTGVCTVTSGGALTFVAAGSCTIDANQAGNSVWNAAATVSQTFSVNATVPGAPTIGVATAGNSQATVTFTGPASTGGSSITSYTVTAFPGGATGTGSGSPITVTGLNNGEAYTFTVKAANSSGAGAASAASNAVTPKSTQSITFGNPGTQNFGTSPVLSATATSSLTVTFTSATTGVCSITSGGSLTFITAGNCTIHADQPGDASYLAAAQVSQSFAVNAIVPGAPTSATATAGDTQASVGFTAPASNGGAGITSYTVTVSPADVSPVSGASSPIVVMGLTNGQSYTFTVAANNSAGTGPASAASNSITPKATQTITFINPGAQNFGTTPTLTATSDSGLTPTFTSSTAGVCSITSGGALSFVTAGNCTINADQAGNGTYLAATRVSQTFTVNGVPPGAPNIGTAAPGNAQATVSFTPPASTGGAAITGYSVTSTPGNITMSGSASPITVTGLTNGTPYTFTVTAVNSLGSGAPSASSNSVVPTLVTVAGPVPGMSGPATATLSGGGASCTLLPSSGFGNVPSGAAPPPGTTMSYGAFEFEAAGCITSVTMTLTYPDPLPPNVQFWKYGPATPLATTSTWFKWNGASLSVDRKTVSYTIVDNGIGDSDFSVGAVRDPFAPAIGPAVAPPAGVASIPTLSQWGLALLSLLMAAGMFMTRKYQHRV